MDLSDNIKSLIETIASATPKTVELENASLEPSLPGNWSYPGAKELSDKVKGAVLATFSKKGTLHDLVFEPYMTDRVDGYFVTNNTTGKKMIFGLNIASMQITVINNLSRTCNGKAGVPSFFGENGYEAAANDIYWSLN